MGQQILIGQKLPNFDCKTTLGPMNFHKFIENSWAMIFSHPADYTPVCTTELSEVAELMEEFE